MHKEIETLRKRAGREEGPAEWDWDEISATMRSAGADPALVPDDLKTYLCEGLFAEPLNLTLSLYSRGELERFVAKDEFFAMAFAAGYFIIGDRDGDFVSVRLDDLVTYLIPGWSITEGVFAKEKRYKDLRSFLKRMAKDLKDEQEMAAEEAEERRQAIATLDPDDPSSMDEKKGRTRLILAIEDHDLETARAELERGANPDQGARKTPLHYAVDERSVEAIDLLIAHGADPNGRPGLRETPLEVAARRGRLELVRALVERGAEVTAAAMALAIPRRDPELIDYLIAQGADPNAGLNAAQLFPDMLGLLLRRGADPSRMPRNSVQLLASGGAKRQLKSLLDAGLEARGSDLARYAGFCDPETARMLLEAGAEPDAVDKFGVTWMEQCLNAAMAQSKKERDAMLATMRVFLEHKADPHRKDRAGTPPLIKAAREGWFEGFELLLEFGADPSATDGAGKTAHDYVDSFRPKKKAAAARKRLTGS